MSKKLTHGTIYTTKLPRRGTDIERVTPASVLDQLTVGEAMQPLAATVGPRTNVDVDHRGSQEAGPSDESADATSRIQPAPSWPDIAGPVLRSRQPQALFTDEVLRQALRQLVLYGRDGLPVISADRQRLCGWIINRNVLAAINSRLHATAAEAAQGEQAARFATPDPSGRHDPPNPLDGYTILEITVTADAAAAGRRVMDVEWPVGSVVVATTHRGHTVAAHDHTQLKAGDRITVLVPATASPDKAEHDAVLA